MSDSDTLFSVMNNSKFVDFINQTLIFLIFNTYTLCLLHNHGISDIQCAQYLLLYEYLMKDSFNIDLNFFLLISNKF